MKKLVLIVLLIAAVGMHYVHADPAPIDLIVLLDTSESMLPYWSETTDYLIKDIITNQLHQGDTFHLISFASRPEIEVAQQIQGEASIQKILARLLLLQPLGRYTDLVAAIKYLYQYTIDLPLSTDKKIIILTDGIDDPPPDSPFPLKLGPNGQDTSDNRQQIIETAQAMRRHGWEVHIIQYPLQGPVPASAAQQHGAQLLSGGELGSAAGAGGGAGSTAAQPAAGATSSGTGQHPGGQAGGTGGGQVGPAGGAAVQGGASGTGGSAAGTRPNGASGNGVVGSQGSAAAPNAEGGKGGTLLNQLSSTLGVPIQQFNGATKEDIAHVATGAPGLTFPGNLGRVGYELTVPFEITNFQNQPVLIQLTGVLYNGADILRRQVTLPVQAGKRATMRVPLQLPVSLQAGPHTIQISLMFNDSLRVSPHQGDLSFTLARGIITAQDASLYILPIVFGVVLIIVIVLIVIFVRRIVSGMAAAPTASVSARVRYDSTKSTIRPIELRVAGQNPNIGGRNIHPTGTGARRSVGGGSSAFLIYLYPMPARIGEITHDGAGSVFTPVRQEFFPTLNGPLTDCLGKEITVRTEDNRTLTISFREYVSPLDEVNRIMHLVDKPGIQS
ncbi:MAG TPA: vWA domain-containing protein [Spirochaetia bacterium]|nr:vWA domain-containing protein [Spirochaetia bacterium]